MTKVIQQPNQLAHHWLQVCTPVAKPYWQPATWLFRPRPTCIILHCPAFPSLALLHDVYECVSQPRFVLSSMSSSLPGIAVVTPWGQPPTLVTKLTCKPPGHTWVSGSRWWPRLSGGGGKCPPVTQQPSPHPRKQMSKRPIIRRITSNPF